MTSVIGAICGSVPAAGHTRPSVASARTGRKTCPAICPRTSNASLNELDPSRCRIGEKMHICRDFDASQAEGRGFEARRPLQKAPLTAGFCRSRDGALDQGSAPAKAMKRRTRL
jgi:hypothetical protein